MMASAPLVSCMLNTCVCSGRIQATGKTKVSNALPPVDAKAASRGKTAEGKKVRQCAACLWGMHPI